jgi:hypothetical protein
VSSRQLTTALVIGTGDTWLPAVNTILEEEIGDGGGSKGGPLAVSIRQPTRQQAMAAGSVIKTTGKKASGSGKYSLTTGDGGGGKVATTLRS